MYLLLYNYLFPDCGKSTPVPSRLVVAIPNQKWYWKKGYVLTVAVSPFQKRKSAQNQQLKIIFCFCYTRLRAPAFVGMHVFKNIYLFRKQEWFLICVDNPVKNHRQVVYDEKKTVSEMAWNKDRCQLGCKTYMGNRYRSFKANWMHFFPIMFQPFKKEKVLKINN